MKQLRLTLTLVAVVAVPVFQSCSSQNDTIVEYPTTAQPTTTTTVQSTTVLDTAFHEIGTIVAYPFRVIGDAVEQIV